MAPTLAARLGGARDFSAELNPEQLAAVTTRARRALVVAGAGSGKTRTLTYRVAWLLEQGVAPWRILLLTFTNKAAREMLERVGSLAGAGGAPIWGGTFHSVANRLLRRHAELLGYRPGFSILDADDQKALMRALVKQHAGKTAHFPKAEQLLSLHSLALNTSRTWQETLRSDYAAFERHAELIGRIFADYAARKLAQNAMDFDDLLLNWLRLLREQAELRRAWQERFEYLLVDEYQDTNAPQDEIVALLAGGEHNCLMAVGDDAQSIYSWRGADVEHMLHFRRRYPDAELFPITVNYRSVPAILELSNAAIAQNECRLAKDLRAARRAGGRRPVVLPAPDNRTEAQWVAQRIDELLAGGVPGSDIAVLYRAHFHSTDVQMELARAHIPYRITSGLRFFEQAHVKDVVAFLRLLANPRDEVAFRRIVGTFPRVGEATAGKLWAQWCAGVEPWLAEHPQASRVGVPHAELLARASIPAAIRSSWEAFVALMDSLHPAGEAELLPAELVHAVHEYLLPYQSRAYENYEERAEDLEQLCRTVGEEEDLDAFLAQVALLSEVDTPAAEEDSVTLSTIHQAKGLEWKVVFVIFLGEGLFPHRRVLESGDPRDVEEERRLFYVAVTRAQDQLYLSFPRYNGRGYDVQYCPPSRFLTALPEELVELWEP